MYNLEYCDNYSKTGSLWQYYRDEAVFTNDCAIKIFYFVDNNSGWFKFKQKITGSIDDGTKNAEIKVPSKH